MDNGDPCFIGVTDTEVLVKKSKVGFFGPKIYQKQNRLWRVDRNFEILEGLYPNILTPDRMTNRWLRSFTNAALHCSTIAEFADVLKFDNTK